MKGINHVRICVGGVFVCRRESAPNEVHRRKGCSSGYCVILHVHLKSDFLLVLLLGISRWFLPGHRQIVEMHNSRAE